MILGSAVDNVWVITITLQANGRVTISPVGGPPADLVKSIVELLQRKPAPVG